MDPKGHIYEGTDEKPVKPEDAARLDGYLKGRAEADAKAAEAARTLVEKARELAAKSEATP
jgi:hypothetical protein